ncbi:hypothetical protein S141_65 [Shewanella sp. phage 1/41]|nr:hypothetical protein S141_65 [Shewanella sp. phage 1/41]AHK11711.1 hypothetical protein S141_65 [Shewanella sp. phage 1/41]
MATETIECLSFFGGYIAGCILTWGGLILWSKHVSKGDL